MMERKRRIPSGQLSPQAPNAKIAPVFSNIMEQRDGALAHLGQPGFEIVPGRIVRVEAVDMQQIDRPIANGGGRLIEGALVKSRECAIQRVVMMLQVR